MERYLPVVYLALLLGGIAYALLRKRRDPTPEELDAKQLRRFAKNGVNLGREQTIEFTLTFPERRVAETAAEQLQRKGFETEVYESQVDPKWICDIRHKTVPTAEKIRGLRLEVEGIGHLEQGQYWGWRIPH